VEIILLNADKPDGQLQFKHCKQEVLGSKFSLVTYALCLFLFGLSRQLPAQYCIKTPQHILLKWIFERLDGGA
jgi:hypothetical protein